LRAQASKNDIRRYRCAKNLWSCGADIFQLWEQFWAGAEPNHPNHRGPIRSILIDFRCSKGLRAVVCAKLFRSNNTRIALKFCAICDADHLQNSSAKHIRATTTQRQKPLFHRMFFKFPRFMHKHISSVSCARDQIRSFALDGPASCGFARAYTFR
jgi:hypothetical protein